MSDNEDHLSAYRAAVRSDIEACVIRMGCQPILFIGSGLSKRYFSGPSWDELLTILAGKCPLIDKDYAYYKQTLKNQIAVGEEFAHLYQQWAWGKGRAQFPSELFSESVSEEAYIKYAIAQYLEKVTPKTLESIDDLNLRAEVAALQGVRPHAVITTNFDRFLEIVFPEYQPIIGQSIIYGSNVLFGEIFKIHGCVSDYGSLVFTRHDYNEFTKKKKYLSAKLLTYFSEHPLLFVGYSASDPNIRAILSDIDEAIPRQGPPGSVIPNIFILEWQSAVLPKYIPPREKLIAIEDGKSVLVKSIETDSFEWVFKAFGANQPLNAVSPKILRALLNRSYDLVRRDIPRQTVDADFEMLEHAVTDGVEFAKLFGITTISAPSAYAAEFPYTISDVAEKVTGIEDAFWAKVQPYFDRIKREKGVDLKKSDNRYHCATKAGRKKGSVVHKYSHHIVELFKQMKKGVDYELKL